MSSGHSLNFSALPVVVLALLVVVLVVVLALLIWNCPPQARGPSSSRKDCVMDQLLLVLVTSVANIPEAKQIIFPHHLIIICPPPCQPLVIGSAQTEFNQSQVNKFLKSKT